MEFHKRLEEIYPQKHDLRKTHEFKQWKLTVKPPVKSTSKPTSKSTAKPTSKSTAKSTSKSTSNPVISGNLRLDIPLWDTGTLKSVQSLETVVEEVLGEGQIYPSLQTDISNDLIESILADLREDPYLTDLFKTVEGDFELASEITIDEDIRLENELA